MKAKIVLKSFPGHLGVPGQYGGSAPRNAADKGGSEGSIGSGSSMTYIPDIFWMSAAKNPHTIKQPVIEINGTRFSVNTEPGEFTSTGKRRIAAYYITVANEYNPSERKKISGKTPEKLMDNLRAYEAKFGKIVEAGKW
jgi:hypothetical protein